MSGWFRAGVGLSRVQKEHWSSINLTMKHAKSVDRSLGGTALGRDLISGKFLMPKRARLRELLSSFHTILVGKRTSPSDFAHFLGVV